MLLNYEVLSKWGTILDALRFCLCIFFFAHFPKLFEHLIILLSVRNSLIPHTPSNYWEEFVGVAHVEISCCEILLE